MFNRYLITTILTIVMITGMALLCFSINTHASCSNQLISFDNHYRITSRLLLKTIDRHNPNLPYNQKTAICHTIIQESNSNNIDPFFVAAVIAAESSFVPNAVSPCAAQGLMQLTAGVIEMMNIKNPFDISQNIYGGTKYLQKLRKMFNNTELTLAAYNAGPTRVARLGRIPRITETINYIRKVQKFYRTMQAEFQTAVLTAYPLCFQFETAPVLSLFATNPGPQPPADNCQKMELMTAFFESKRKTKYGTLKSDNLNLIVHT